MEILTLFLIMVAIIACQSIIYKKLSFKGLEYHCEFDREEAFEGDEISLTEVVENRKWLPLPWFKSEITTSKWLDFAGAQSTVTYRTRFVPSFFLVKGHKKVTRRWKVQCARRGIFPIDTVVLVSTDLLGSQKVSHSVSADSVVTVLPKPFDLGEEFIHARYLMGDTLVRFQLIPDPFLISGVREYLPSDPMKNVHWNATAKMGRIMIRNQDYTTRQNVLVLLNMQSNEYEFKEVADPQLIENGIRTVASLLDATLEDSLPVSFGVNASPDGAEGVSALIGPNYGSGYIYGLYRTLAALPEGSNQAFSEFLGQLEIQPDVTDVVVVTPYLNERIFDFCTEQQGEGRAVKILALRYTEQEIPENCDVYFLRKEVFPKHETKS